MITSQRAYSIILENNQNNQKLFRLHQANPGANWLTSHSEQPVIVSQSHDGEPEWYVTVCFVNRKLTKQDELVELKINTLYLLSSEYNQIINLGDWLSSSAAPRMITNGLGW